MSLVRPIIACVLILAMLPWGAYARTFGPAHVRGQIEVGDQTVWQTADVVVTAVQALSDAADEAVVSATKRCRAAGLPGSPCGPDLRLPSEMAVMPAIRVSAVVYPVAQHRLSGRVPAGIPDPPRSC
jgi:hypothetical protein